MHAPILSDQLPKVTAFLVNERFFNPGNSFDRAMDRFKGVETPSLPVMAPFVMEIDAMVFARRPGPKHVIPLRDGSARDYFLKQRYATYEPFMQRAGITFHRLEAVGQGITLNGRLSACRLRRLASRAAAGIGDWGTRERGNAEMRKLRQPRAARS